MMITYILDLDDKPIRCNDMAVYGQYMSDHYRVAKDQVGLVEISTVFLGLDHNWGTGKPILFETMVFGGSMDGEQQRYTSKQDALNGHAVMVTAVKAAEEMP